MGTMETISRIYIDGRPWRVLFGCRLRDADGLCDYDTNTIKIRKGLHGIDLLDAILHELIHARWPDLHEAAVEDFSETVSGFLHAKAFRQPDDHEE